MPSLRASLPTSAASRLASLRRPWSTVTAISFGFALSDLRQRAASSMSAVESGPPETASNKTGNCSRPEKSDLASDCETEEVSAVATLLFLRDVALHGRRRLGIFAADF